MMQLLTTEQAAELLGLEPATLATWRWRGFGPPHVRLSARAVRYRRDDLASWLDSRTRRSTSDCDATDASCA